MKVIIRDIGMGVYLNGKSSRTKFQSEATQFENSIEALEFCVTHKLQDVELLLLMADPRMDTPLKLFPRTPATPGFRGSEHPIPNSPSLQP